MICRVLVIGASIIAVTMQATADGIYNDGWGYKDGLDVFSIPSTITQSNNQISVQFAATNSITRRRRTGCRSTRRRAGCPAPAFPSR